tara:strand:+ start:462 stop:2459 length:1998 start_codon:yes stop_codon:yes gene_type:complete
MATLSGQTIANRYSSLLKTANDGAVTSTLTVVESGEGTDSDLSIATNKVKVGTTLGIGVLPSLGKLHINAGTGQAVTIDNGNASFIIGKGSQYGFCIGDCNPVATVGGGSSSTAAQANKNYIASNPAANSNTGSIVIMNGASAGTGGIGVGQDTVASGFIHFGDANKKFYFEGRNVAQSFDVFANSESLLSVDGNAKRVGLGENIIAPTTTVEIGETGSKANLDILSISNKFWNADMDGTASSIAFKHMKAASTYADEPSGRIQVGTESDWTGTSTTRDSYMAIQTSLNGNCQEKVRITSDGNVGIGHSSPTEKLYVSGDAYVTGSLKAGSFVDTNKNSRYELEEYFAQNPAANGSIGVAVNLNFELQGTSATAAADANHAGCLLTTDSTSGREACIMPHADTRQTAWYNLKFGTEDELKWECAITTHATAANAKNTVRYHAGLLSGHTRLADNVAATSIADYAYFYYDSADTTFANQTDNTKWHFAYGVDGVDYITKLDTSLENDTTYIFRIETHSDRTLSAYVNDVQVGLTTWGVAAATGRTGVAIDNGAGYGTSGSSVAMTVDTVDATTVIVVGDTLADSGGNIIGTVTAVAATTVTVGSVLHAVVDDEILYIFGNKAASNTTKGSALHAGVDLYPQIGVTTRHASARTLIVHYQKLSRNLK